MRRIILAPDSFKGTMSAVDICNVMASVIGKHYPEAEVIKMPIADGGEGTVDCYLTASGGKRVTVKVKGPYLEEIDSFYGILPDGRTAVIEMAAAAGLPLVEGRKDPAATSTYGVGQLIGHALESGCNSIIIGLGGSCTNDGGAGMAAALGVRFIDKDGRDFIPTGGTLDRISHIDLTGRHKLVGKASVIAACDVNNPLCGPSGAAHVYGPQKGAGPEVAAMLDKNLFHFSEVIKKELGMDLLEFPGAGAAGGMGAGVKAFLGADLKPGIDIVLNTLKFDDLLNECDLVITGEGRIDEQSIRGKAVSGIGGRARRAKVHVVAVVGDIAGDMSEIYDAGISAVMSINRRPEPFEESRWKTRQNIEYAVDTLMRLIKLKY